MVRRVGDKAGIIGKLLVELIYLRCSIMWCRQALGMIAGEVRGEGLLTVVIIWACSTASWLCVSRNARSCACDSRSSF